MQARFAVIVVALVAILGIEIVVIVLGRTAVPGDVLGGLLVTLAGMAAALLADGLVAAVARRLGVRTGRVAGAVAHTVVAAYALFVATGVDAPFGWLLGVLFGAVVGAALPSLLIGPATGWVPALVAARIAAFIGVALLLALR